MKLKAPVEAVTVIVTSAQRARPGDPRSPSTRPHSTSRASTVRRIARRRIRLPMLPRLDQHRSRLARPRKARIIDQPAPAGMPIVGNDHRRRPDTRRQRPDRAPTARTRSADRTATTWNEIEQHIRRLHQRPESTRPHQLARLPRPPRAQPDPKAGSYPHRQSATPSAAQDRTGQKPPDWQTPRSGFHAAARGRARSSASTTRAPAISLP